MKCSSVHTPTWSWERGQALSAEWNNESRTRLPVRKKFSYQKKVWAVETRRSHSKFLNKMLSVKLPGFPGGSVVKYPPAVPEMQMWVWYLGREHPLEEGMATDSSILPWRIPWAEEPGGQQPIGSQRAEPDCSDLACKVAIVNCPELIWTTWVGSLFCCLVQSWDCVPSKIAIFDVGTSLMWMPWQSKLKSSPCIIKRRGNCLQNSVCCEKPLLAWTQN